MNKKAIVFTFIAIIMIILLIAIFLLNISNRAQRDIQKNNIKIEALNSLVNSLNNELLQETLRSSSNQVFLALLDDLENKNQGGGKGQYVKGDLYKEFADALVTGYYQKQELKLMFQGKLNYTLMNITGELIYFIKDNGAIFSFKPIDKYDVTIFQQDPWNINVSLIISYNLNDSSNEISWNIKNKQISILLPVENYREPFYIVEDNLNVTINKTDVTTWTFDEFKRHINKRLFIAHSDAPSFLDRLQGKKGNNINGIETILDPNFYPNPSKSSNVDFEYRDSVKGKCLVNGMPNNFKLTSAHLSYYQQSGTCS